MQEHDAGETARIAYGSQGISYCSLMSFTTKELLRDWSEIRLLVSPAARRPNLDVIRPFFIMSGLRLANIVPNLVPR
jgi:hypothetical protein